MAKKYRVIQWTAGTTGKLALRAMLQRPDLELVGMWVHSPEDAGLDAGSFVGHAPTGVVTTTDQDAMLGLDADIVAYFAREVGRPSEETVDDLCQILESGKNVVTTLTTLNRPELLGPELQGRLEAACAAGQTTLYGTGINGDGAHAVLAALASMCQRIESTSIYEPVNIESYEQYALFLGFGMAPADFELSPAIEAMVRHVYGPVLHFQAAMFGLEIDEHRFEQEYLVADEELRLPAFSIDKGTVCAVRFGLHGSIGGQRRVTQAGCYWLGDHPSGWEPPPGNGGYVITIKGEPDMQVRWSLAIDETSLTGRLSKDRSAGERAMMAVLLGTAARAVNAIPLVCGAPPGITRMLDHSYYHPLIDAAATLS